MTEFNYDRRTFLRRGAMGAGALWALSLEADGAGGTTNLIFDTKHGRWAKAWSSLAGTIRNCAGGVTPWGTWITGEETFGHGHGYSFDVDAQNGDRRPIVSTGRFSHEATMVDPATGYVYETEDATPSGFHKYVPDVPGKVVVGGRLYMLKVKNQPNFNFGPVSSVSMRWDVEWVPIDDPDASVLTTYAQGASAPHFGAQFRRLEGCWWGDQTGYFLSTNGAPRARGRSSSTTRSRKPSS